MSDGYRLPATLGADDVGTTVTVRGREKQVRGLGTLQTWEGELLTLCLLPGGLVEVSLQLPDGARRRLELAVA